MLTLILYVGSDRYALDCSQVVEVIPMVNLRKIHRAANYVAGSFQYRGAIVPAIDLCQLLQGTPSVPYLSTRIVVLNCHQWMQHSDPDDRSDSFRLIGMIAQQVTETLNISETDLVPPVFLGDDAPYLGEMIEDRQGMIQLIKIENLLNQSEFQSEFSYLLPESKADP